MTVRMTEKGMAVIREAERLFKTGLSLAEIAVLVGVPDVEHLQLLMCIANETGT